MKKENETMADYLADPGLGSSQLKQILESPRDYQFSLKAPKKESSAQSKGTLWHTYMLERDLYHEQHLIQPEDWGSLSENPGRKKWNDLKAKAKAENKTPVKYRDAADLLLLEDVIEAHEPLKKILATHKPEVSFYSEYDGIQLKSREDLWCEHTCSVWDVKTSSKMFQRDEDLDTSLGRIIFENGYHFSAVHHMMCMKKAGFPVKSWGWIFVSTATTCPHIVIRKASNKMLIAGYSDWKKAISLLKDCQEKNEWEPWFDDEISVIDFPDWIQNKY